MAAAKNCQHNDEKVVRRMNSKGVRSLSTALKLTHHRFRSAGGITSVKMPSNVEIKAKVEDLETMKRKAKEVSGSDGVLIVQEDTFFNATTGRLKLRQLQNEKSMLIFYNRPDQTGPKFSEYHITTIEDPESLKVTLGKAYGIKGVVKKKRFLFLVDQTRIHVDDVEGLGSFMELEVAMKENQTTEEGQQIAEDLMKKLDIQKNSLITGAYMDLLLK